MVGIEVDGSKVAAVQRGESYVQDIPSERLAALTNDERRTMEGHQPLAIGHRLVATTDFSVLAQCDAAIIAVPTPLSKTRDPDMKYVLAAGKAVAQVVHPGMLVVLESTTYPGTTEELLLPMLCQAMGVERCAVGQQFFLAFSPERIDQGNQRYTVENTPKVVGGTTPACREVAEALYGAIIERIVPVSSTQAA
ncbi:MAG: UDP-N-acetyl-D-glucosamine dehydrogenase, partial [Anaerolineae bacterium]